MMWQKCRLILKHNMFSGIIANTAKIVWLREQPPFFELCISCAELLADISLGSSIAVNGVCLTVKKIQSEHIYFDISSETLRSTTLGFLKVEESVNIELAGKFGDHIGGHIVSGHVDGIGIIRQKLDDQNGVRFEIGCDPAWMKYILQKGSIAIDGVSLTINDPANDGFFVHLIPETLRRTIFSLYRVSDRVNLEFDKITQTVVDTVERVLKNR